MGRKHSFVLFCSGWRGRVRSLRTSSFGCWDGTENKVRKITVRKIRASRVGRREERNRREDSTERAVWRREETTVALNYTAPILRVGGLYGPPTTYRPTNHDTTCECQVLSWSEQTSSGASEGQAKRKQMKNKVGDVLGEGVGKQAVGIPGWSPGSAWWEFWGRKRTTKAKTGRNDATKPVDGMELLMRRISPTMNSS